MHTKLGSLNDDAESVILITFLVKLFWVIKNCESARCEKKDNYGLCALSATFEFSIPPLHHVVSKGNLPKCCLLVCLDLCRWAPQMEVTDNCPRADC